MQRSFVVKSPINFANFGFFVRVGDILVHDTANGNRLTVYRGGEIVKAITHTGLGMAALLKQGFVSELAAPQRPAIVAVPPKPPEAPKKAIPAPRPPVSEPEIDKLKQDAMRKDIKKKARAEVVEDQSVNNQEEDAKVSSEKSAT